MQDRALHLRTWPEGWGLGGREIQWEEIRWWRQHCANPKAQGAGRTRVSDWLDVQGSEEESGDVLFVLLAVPGINSEAGFAL